jgi:hypothetical protein
MSKHSKQSTFAVGVAFAGFFGGFVFCAFLLSGFPRDGDKPPFMNLNFDPATTLTIVLTALSIMLTALGILIAVVGVFGFGFLRSEAFNAAAEHANEQLGEDGELRRIIEKRVDAIVARLQSGQTTTKDFPNPESEYGE